jgi:hypothetical protein
MQIALKPMRPRTANVRPLEPSGLVAADLLRPLSLRIADRPSDFLLAARLVHDAYVARGVLDAQSSGLRVTRFSALPSTLAVVALEGDRVVGTVSLVRDSAEGLPMEAAYPDEVRERRAMRVIAEVGSLAVDHAYRHSGLAYVITGMAARVAELVGVEELVFAIHPRAEGAYRDDMCCERIGDVKTYAGLNPSAVSVAMATTSANGFLPRWLRNAAERGAMGRTHARLFTAADVGGVPSDAELRAGAFGAARLAARRVLLEALSGRARVRHEDEELAPAAE